MDPKYKVGDKVRVCGINSSSENLHELLVYVGTEGVVDEVLIVGDAVLYSINTDVPVAGDYYWEEQELELASENKI